ncbi:hypothetical protein EON65_08815 [archaeon]|nr:MAG: hypothetical protein EON65_08815 [archaeon]
MMPQDVGGSQGSGVYVPQQQHRFMESSQESARSQGTSQPASLVSSFEGSPLDGGRSQARFQEFVSRTRHMELLESVRELHTKVASLESKIDQLQNQNNLLIQHQCNNQHQFKEIIQHSLDDQSYFQSLDQKVQRISMELQQNLALLSQMHSVIEEQSHVSQHRFVSETYREVSMSKAMCLDNLWEEDSDCGEGIPVADYLFTRSKKVIFFMI